MCHICEHQDAGGEVEVVRVKIPLDAILRNDRSTRVVLRQILEAGGEIADVEPIHDAEIGAGLEVTFVKPYTSGEERMSALFDMPDTHEVQTVHVLMHEHDVRLN